MGRLKKKSLEDLILENKNELLNDREALEKIEARMEERAQRNLFE